MEIIDSQVHVWGADSPERPWPPGRAHEAQRPEPVSHAMVLSEMEAAGVDRAVLVPPSWEGDRNDLALAAARAHPDRFAVMGRIALDRPESRRQMAGWRKQPGMLGMRLTFHLEPSRSWLTDGTVDWLWREAEGAGIPLMVAVPGSLSTLGRIAGRHPGLKLTIDHAGARPDRRGPEAFAELDELCRLAALDNVAVKLSGLAALSLEPFPFRDLEPAIRRLVDAFGPRRAFWGSDLTRMPCSYRQCVELFTEHLRGLSHDDLAWIMGRGVREWLAWDPHHRRSADERQGYPPV